MRKKFDRLLLRAFLTRPDESLDRPGVVFLLGRSSPTWRGVKVLIVDKVISAAWLAYCKVVAKLGRQSIIYWLMTISNKEKYK